MSSSEERDDDRLRHALQSLPVPATPDLESRVNRRLRARRVRRAGAVAGVAAVLLVGLFVWTPWHGQPAGRVPDDEFFVPVAQVRPDITLDDLDVLFAPPPVDSLAVLDRRDAVSVAALNRLEGLK